MQTRLNVKNLPPKMTATGLVAEPQTATKDKTVDKIVNKKVVITTTLQAL